MFACVRSKPAKYWSKPYRLRPPADDPTTLELVQLMRRAKKPIIIVGQGCNDASEELKTFAEALQIPVTTALHALLGCFDERNPLALNTVGMHGDPTPNCMVQEADLVLCIGSRFDDRMCYRTPHERFCPRSASGCGGRTGWYFVHVDIRLTEHKKQVEPTFFVHSTGFWPTILSSNRSREIGYSVCQHSKPTCRLKSLSFPPKRRGPQRKTAIR